MPDQLYDLADRAERDELVTVRVIPFGAGAHRGLLGGPFTLLRFDGGPPDVLYLDVGRGFSTLISDNDPQVAAYTEDFEKLTEDALSADESIFLIREAAQKMQKF